MTTINTHELTGAALDWAVASAEGLIDTDLVLNNKVISKVVIIDRRAKECVHMMRGITYAPSTNPDQGHEILEREKIGMQYIGKRIGWGARWPVWIPDGDGQTMPSADGPTMLIAGLRCYAIARLGHAVDVPQELLP